MMKLSEEYQPGWQAHVQASGDLDHNFTGTITRVDSDNGLVFVKDPLDSVIWGMPSMFVSATALSLILARIAATQDGNPVMQLMDMEAATRKPAASVCDNLNRLIVDIARTNLETDGLGVEGIIADFMYCANQLAKAARYV